MCDRVRSSEIDQVMWKKNIDRSMLIIDVKIIIIFTFFCLSFLFDLIDKTL